MSLAFWNGRLVPAEEVRIPPGDSGFLGDGLFETLRVDQGEAESVKAHLDRLFFGLERIGIEEDRKALAAGVAAVAGSAPRPLARMRITVTRETCLVTASPYTPPSGAVTAILLPGPWVFSRSPLAGLKSLSRQANQLALRRAEAAGAFEALLLNERGLLAEGSRSNVIVALPEGVFTPPLEDGCLPGIIRGYLLASGTVAERSITVDDLRRAKQVLLTNSLIGALSVVKLVSYVPTDRGAPGASSPSRQDPDRTTSDGS